ncbi:cytochrome PufQ [Pontivivens ytuae]|nr:cytochrome PufQ [Pontivivens ytuae]
MSDISMHEAQPHRHRRMPRAEYWVYFSLIFAISLPLALAMWLAGLVGPSRRIGERGVIHHAWSQARIITPQIFSA